MLDTEKVKFFTKEEYRKLRIFDRAFSDIIVVDGIIEKNRFGNEGIPYKGSFGCCHVCNKDIKIRELLNGTYLGCMC